MTASTDDRSSSPPQRGGEVARAKPETERGPATSRRSPKYLARARQLRHGDNMAEAVIWTELKARRLGGHKFARQVPIGPYFADFVSRSAKLVVELDGSQHADSDHDRRRDDFLRASGYSVLRFWSHDAVQETASVCQTILAVLEGRLSDETEAPDMKFKPAVKGSR